MPLFRTSLLSQSGPCPIILLLQLPWRRAPSHSWVLRDARCKACHHPACLTPSPILNISALYITAESSREPANRQRSMSPESITHTTSSSRCVNSVTDCVNGNREICYFVLELAATLCCGLTKTESFHKVRRWEQSALSNTHIRRASDALGFNTGITSRKHRDT